MPDYTMVLAVYLAEGHSQVLLNTWSPVIICAYI